MLIRCSILLPLLASCSTPAELSDLPASSADHLVQAVPPNNRTGDFFTQFATVFGVYAFASEEVPPAKFEHAIAVLAEYLDNDGDGVADDPQVVATLLEERGVLVMFADENDIESSGLFGSWFESSFNFQDLRADETNPEFGFDASLEEVLHLITHVGLANAYPNDFGERRGTTLANAMDLARGGYFATVPSEYPEEGWYHYDDTSCDYGCMATEYVYWALTSLLGAQSDSMRCEDITHEWELCTPTQVRAGDPAITTLLEASDYLLPTRLPDGQYP